MNDIMNEFSLNSYDLYMNESFFEFSYAVDAITAYRESNELYLEAVNDPGAIRDNRIKQDLQATADTTRKTLKAADAVIDAKAGVIRASVNLIFKVFGYAGKILSFMSGKVVDMINGISNLMDDISRIPENVRGTIRGDIKLYITAEDIMMIYNQSVIKQLDDAISTLDLVTSGDQWGYAFHKNTVKPGVKSNDVKLAQRLKDIAFRIKNVHFSQSSVRMDSEQNRNKYFSNAKVVKFRDLKGKNHDDSYLEALRQLMADLVYRKESIHRLEDAFNEKLNRTEINQTWANLDRGTRDQITGILTSTSSILATIGGIYKYAGIDIKTISDSAKKISKKYDKKEKNETAEK